MKARPAHPGSLVVMAALSLSSVILGCSVQAFEEAGAAPAVVNSCTTQAQCGPNGQCRSGMCVAALGQLTDVIVEVVPPAAAYYGAGDSFIVSVDGVELPSMARDLSLPQYASIAGQITTMLGEATACSSSYDAASGTLGVRVELTRSEATWGLPAATYETSSQWVAADGAWRFAVSVPTGIYDMYVSPLADCEAEFPPVLLRQVIFRDAGAVQYALDVSAPSEIHGKVKLPDAQPDLLDGWSVSLLEPRQGRTISTTHTWHAGSGTDFVLRYHQDDNGDTPLVQVTPPDGVIAPSILWDLSVLDLDGNGEIGLDLSGVVLDSVKVRARVLDASASPGQMVGVGGASVRLQSLDLDGFEGVSARFDATVTADNAGQVQTDLLPGRYRLVVFPPDASNLAMTTDEWLIAASPKEQAGRTVQVSERSQLDGWVVEPLAGEPLKNTTVSLTPSSAAPSSYLDKAISPPDASPRPVSGFTDSDGRFDISVDPGSFDMAVQPRSDQALPWLVRSRLKVPNDGLGSMTMSLPVPLGGVLRDPNGNPVQQALLRVYAPLDAAGATVSSPTFGTSAVQGVLQVAEARSDETGQFRILLPSTIR